MTLTKGFLRPRPFTITSDYLIGVSLGIGFSFGLYALFYFFREGYRIMAPFIGLGQLLVLSPEENFWYNLFYGSIASVLGFYVFVKFVIDDSFYYQNKKTKLKLRHISNEQSFFFWTFLSVFGRMASFIGFWFLLMPLQFEINFLNDYPWLLILIPLVLYLNIWPPIQRAAGRQGYKWIAFSLIPVMLLSLLYAHINFMDYRQVNKNLLAYDVVLAHSLIVPESRSQEVSRGHLTVEFFLVKDSAGDSPLIYLNDTHTQLQPGNFQELLIRERAKFPASRQGELTANLHIDTIFRLGFVNQLKEELRKAGFYKIQYSTAPKNSNYPNHYPYFRYKGMPETLHPYYPEWVSLIDSAENLGLSKYTFHFTDSGYYRPREIIKYNQIKIEVRQDKIYLNNKEISEESLQDLTYKFIKKYSPDYRIIFEAEEDITFGRYIEAKDILYSTIDKLRNEMAYELYNKPYAALYDWSETSPIKGRYPKSLVEWTPEEKRLMELMSRAGKEN